jgi:hypothetical protein
MFGATSVISSVADSCSWRAGLPTQLGYLLVSTFEQLREPPSGDQVRPSATGGAGASTGTNTRSR